LLLLEYEDVLEEYAGERLGFYAVAKHWLIFELEELIGL